jgi:hypothetical protein
MPALPVPSGSLFPAQAQCLAQFLQLPIEDAFIGELERGKGAGAAVPFLEAPNPVMTQVGRGFRVSRPSGCVSPVPDKGGRGLAVHSHTEQERGADISRLLYTPLSRARAIEISSPGLGRKTPASAPTHSVTHSLTCRLACPLVPAPVQVAFWATVIGPSVAAEAATKALEVFDEAAAKAAAEAEGKGPEVWNPWGS